jgi:hypothetical protein
MTDFDFFTLATRKVAKRSTMKISFAKACATFATVTETARINHDATFRK